MQAQGSPLVQGATLGAQAPQVCMRVLRAFLLGGQRQEVGAVVVVSRALAAELIYQRRAERLPDVAPTAGNPATTTAAPAEPAPPPTPRAPRRTQEPKDAA